MAATLELTDAERKWLAGRPETYSEADIARFINTGKENWPKWILSFFTWLRQPWLREQTRAD
ncbi:MAG: hypothetical protein ACO1Q7_03435 [Gemmatimonas sp.]